MASPALGQLWQLDKRLEFGTIERVDIKHPPYAADRPGRRGTVNAFEPTVGRDLTRYAKDRTERAREELVAEIGSALLCADLGIVPELEPRPDHAAYVGSWLSVLGDDKRAIFQAAAHAQRAVNFLHALQPAASEEREAA